MELIEYYEVFRGFAKSLPLEDRSEVFAALERNDPVLIFQVLEALRTQGKLTVEIEKT